MSKSLWSGMFGSQPTYQRWPRSKRVSSERLKRERARWQRDPKRGKLRIYEGTQPTAADQALSRAVL